MKFQTNIVVTLLAVHQTAAFVVQPTKSGGTAIQSSYSSDVYGGATRGATTGYQPDIRSPYTDRGPISTRAPPQPSMERNPSGVNLNQVWEESTPTTVQGGSLRTWSFDSPVVERVQVMMKTDGRPLNSNLDLWHGPDNTPQRLQIYVEDGSVRPFCAVIETPRGSNVVAVRNTGHLEFPMYATVSVGETVGNGAIPLPRKPTGGQSVLRTVQGGAIFTTPFDPEVAAVRILLKTDGRPLKARVELLQGPNNNKQVVDIYTEDGMERPFYAVMETPGVGNVVRIVNTATVEFPLTAMVEPFRIEQFDMSQYGRPDQDWNDARSPFQYGRPDQDWSTNQRSRY